MGLFKHPLSNPWTRENIGAPAAPQGGLGLFLPQRKLITPSWIPNRWERFKIRGWAPYHLTIPSEQIPGYNPGLWALTGFDVQQFAAQCPVFYAIGGFLTWSNQREGATISIYDVNAQQALTNPSGPDLLTANMGGTGKHPFFLKKFLFLDPGDEILATISNLSPNPQIGQVAMIGFQPLFPGDLGS